MTRQQGMGLPELLISFFLSTLLLMIVMQHVLQSKQQSHVIFSAINESLEVQWLADFFRSRIRSAGFTPCLRIDRLVRVDTRAQQESLTAIEVRHDPDLRLMIHRMRDESVIVRHQISARELLIDTSGLRVEHAVLIADCYHAEIHEVERITHTSEGDVMTLRVPLVFKYTEPFYAGEWVSESFFSRVSTEGIRGLYYQLYRVDQLMSHVRDFSAKLDQSKGLTMVHLVLGLDDNRTWRFDTRVRAR